VQTPHGEATARGAAFLAGLRAGVYPSLEFLGKLTGEARVFAPTLAPELRAQRRAEWHKAVRTVIAHYTNVMTDLICKASVDA